MEKQTETFKIKTITTAINYMFGKLILCYQVPAKRNAEQTEVWKGECITRVGLKQNRNW